MKFNKVTIVKGACLLMSILGVIGTSWVSTQENKATLAKLVEEQLNKQ